MSRRPWEQDERQGGDARAVRETSAGVEKRGAEAEELGGRRGTGPIFHACDTMKDGRSQYDLD